MNCSTRIRESAGLSGTTAPLGLRAADSLCLCTGVPYRGKALDLGRDNPRCPYGPRGQLAGRQLCRKQGAGTQVEHEHHPGLHYQECGQQGKASVFLLLCSALLGPFWGAVPSSELPTTRRTLTYGSAPSRKPPGRSEGRHTWWKGRGWENWAGSAWRKDRGILLLSPTTSWEVMETVEPDSFQRCTMTGGEARDTSGHVGNSD